MTALDDRHLGGVHHVFAGLCAACCVYNLLRTLQEPNWRNGLNTAIYGAGWLWESARTRDHWRQQG